MDMVRYNTSYFKYRGDENIMNIKNKLVEV